MNKAMSIAAMKDCHETPAMKSVWQILNREYGADLANHYYLQVYWMIGIYEPVTKELVIKLAEDYGVNQ